MILSGDKFLFVFFIINPYMDMLYYRASAWSFQQIWVEGFPPSLCWWNVLQERFYSKYNEQTDWNLQQKSLGIYQNNVPSSISQDHSKISYSEKKTLINMLSINFTQDAGMDVKWVWSKFYSSLINQGITKWIVCCINFSLNQIIYTATFLSEQPNCIDSIFISDNMSLALKPCLWRQQYVSLEIFYVSMTLQESTDSLQINVDIFTF